MDEFLKRIEQSIVTRKLLRDGDAVLVAVSGGLDSMVLLHALHALAAKHRWILTAVHFNHLLRGRAADADHRFVARAAEKLGVRFESASADVRAFAKEQKLSVEMAARKLRHEFFARTALALGITTVSLAHHADDQIELFLLRLLRGASSSGLGGMRWMSPSAIDARVTLVRPLLDMRKTELAAWARENKIKFREDATNAGTNILRNRIRHTLLPLLRRRYQPGLDQVILRESELLRDEAGFITYEAQRWLKSRRAFEWLPVALQRRVLQLELLRAGIAPDFSLIEQLRTRTDRWMSVDAKTRCRRDAGANIELRNATDDLVGSVCALPLDLRKSGSADFDGVTFRWSLTASSRLPKAQKGREFFDAEAVGDRIILRHWRSGDRFQPIGMKSPVKLQDIFTNQKIPRKRRHTLIVATIADGEVFWVEGLRIGERFKILPATTRRLEWRWRRG